jgi:hypothetical protein
VDRFVKLHDGHCKISLQLLGVKVFDVASETVILLPVADDRFAADYIKSSI